MENELIPLKTGFDLALRGFDRNQVTQHLQAVQEEQRVLQTDRDSALSQVDRLTERLNMARSEIDSLNQKNDELSKAPVNATDLGERLNRMVSLANADAKDITTRAETAAANTRAEADEDAKKLRKRYQDMLDELDKTRDERAAEHEETMRKAHAEIERLNAEAKNERDRLDKEATDLRTKAENAFNEELKNKKDRLAKEIADRDAASKRDANQRLTDATEEANKRLREATEEAQRRVDEATEQANQHIERATAQVTALQGLRGQVRGQLGEVLELLQKAAPALDADADEAQALEQNAKRIGQSGQKGGTWAQNGEIPTSRQAGVGQGRTTAGKEPSSGKAKTNGSKGATESGKTGNDGHGGGDNDTATNGEQSAPQASGGTRQSTGQDVGKGSNQERTARLPKTPSNAGSSK